MNRLKNRNKHIGSINFCIPGTMSRCGAGTTWQEQKKCKFARISTRQQMYVLHRVNRRSLRLCCRPARTQRWNKRYIDTDLVTLGRIKGTTNIRAKMHAKDTNPGTSTLTNIGSPFSCSLTKIPLLRPEKYDSFLSVRRRPRVQVPGSCLCPGASGQSL